MRMHEMKLNYRDRQPRRRGFTLLELMAVIAIIGILVALTAGAAFKYYALAKQRATEAVITTLDNALTQRWESFWAKVNPAALPHHILLAGTGEPSIENNEPLPVRQTRAKLIAKLDAMKGDFPQQFADFIICRQAFPAAIAPWANDYGLASPVTGRARTAIEQEYRRLTGQTTNAATQIMPHDPNTESGACLYLILKVGSGESATFDMSQIPASFIKDTDGDGVPEFIDSWGTPLRFYRWPTDYLTHMILVSGQMAGGATRNQNQLDAEKYLARQTWTSTPPSGGAPTGRTQRSNAFEINAPTNPPVGTPLDVNQPLGGYFRVHESLLLDPPQGTPNQFAPASLPAYPIIVSAGPDAVNFSRQDKWQAFGLEFRATAVPSPPTGPPSWPAAPPQITALDQSWPPPNNLDARGARVVPAGATANDSPPEAGAAADNIVSRTLRSGQESQ